MRKYVRKYVRTFLFRFTRWGAARVGLAVLPRSDVNTTREKLAEFCDYAMRSGHLTNRYKAGQRVCLLAGQMHRLLGRAWIPPNASS